MLSVFILSAATALSNEPADAALITKVPAHIVYGYPSEQMLVDTCLTAAAQKYQVNDDLLRAILRTEGGYRGAKSKNKNGSFDYGWAQTNSIHLRKLGRYGITKEQLMYDPCISIGTMAWMVAKHLRNAEPGDGGFWKAVGNYHSTTPSLNRTYREKVWANVLQIRRERESKAY